MPYQIAFTRPTLLAAALAASFPAWSQVDPAPTTTLETIVVTSVAPESPLTFSANPKQPRQPVPASDGADYLQTIPGFSAIRNGGTNADPVLRGMFGSRLNMLSNGGAMPAPARDAWTAPSSYITPENFDRLTVIKGPQTVLGARRFGRTIRFERERGASSTEPGPPCRRQAWSGF